MTDMVKIDYKVVNGTSYHVDTPDDLVQVLEQVRQSRQRVRLVYGDVKTGRKWDEDFRERGTLGRSMGPVAVPLIIRTSRSLGGEAIIDSAILQVLSSPSKHLLWEHLIMRQR